MSILSTAQLIEVLAGLVTILGAIISFLIWNLRYYKNKIQSELRREFWYEIDRIVTEQSHVIYFLENHVAGYVRLQISGEYRSIFNREGEFKNDE
jgi:hypothetical protein